jgi:hypothetical protein
MRGHASFLSGAVIRGRVMECRSLRQMAGFRQPLAGAAR